MKASERLAIDLSAAVRLRDKALEPLQQTHNLVMAQAVEQFEADVRAANAEYLAGLLREDRERAKP